MVLQQIYDRAIASFQAGQAQEAERLCVQALKSAPRDFQGNHLLGMILFAQGRAEAALERYDRALKVRPDEAAAHYNRANALQALNRLDAALDGYDRALALNPALAEAWNNRGNVLRAQSRFADAVASYDHVLRLHPGIAEIWKNRADLLQMMMQFDAALSGYDQALAIQPGAADVWAARGNVLRCLRRPAEALASYDRALALSPHYPDVLGNRAIVLRDMGRFAEALDSYDRVLAQNPADAGALFHRGTLQWVERGQLDAATRDLEQAVARDAAYPYAAGMLLHLKMHACDWRSHDADVARVEAGLRAGLPVAEPFVYQAVSQSPADLLACSAIHAAHRYPALPPVHRGAMRGPARGDGKIRIGYVSGEFRAQATAYLAAGLYERHDRSRFEIFAFDNGGDDASPMRARLQAAFGRIIDIKALSDPAAAQAIAELEIDILVNLNGYFGDHRMGVFARRPAPLQVNYLGFPATLGAAYIDYIIADRVVIPAAEQGHYSEKPVWLPGSYQVNDDRRAIAPDIPARAACGLPDTGFVFCNFNNSYKLTPGQFAAWMRILQQTPGSVLWLLESNSVFAAHLRREAQAQGVSPDRLVFAPMLPLDRHLARLTRADLFVDSLPYNAHTTASDALWAGVPVLTCRGTAFAGRVGASLLLAAGLPELVTETPGDYDAMAVRLATRPDLLAALRARLANTGRNAPLFDTDRFRRHLESAYARMIDIRRRGEAPQAFSVPEDQ